jgi:anti-anti-sigma factor
MKVKIDTKERFHVITLPGPSISASMTEEISNCLLPYLQNDVKNLILDLQQVQSLDIISAENLVKIQQKFYDNNASFVVFGLQPGPEKLLDQEDLLEMMNVTLTESEAWDIVQMEEIARELLNGEE